MITKSSLSKELFSWSCNRILPFFIPWQINSLIQTDLRLIYQLNSSSTNENLTGILLISYIKLSFWYIHQMNEQKQWNYKSISTNWATIRLIGWYLSSQKPLLVLKWKCFYDDYLYGKTQMTPSNILYILALDMLYLIMTYDLAYMICRI